MKLVFEFQVHTGAKLVQHDELTGKSRLGLEGSGFRLANAGLIKNLEGVLEFIGSHDFRGLGSYISKLGPAISKLFDVSAMLKQL